MTKFSSLNREENLAELKREKLDVLVVGGGITGAGIALDAVTRGLKIGLVEMQDFSSGTSSRSTKLVHGGLRYLKQFEIGIVAEVGKEREIVYENGPHVTTPEWMLLPFYKGGTFGPLSTNIGLQVYDFLAGVKKSERRKMLSSEEAAHKEPLLNKQGLKGAGYYVEYKTDDARLTIEVIKEAVKYNAKAVNYTKVVDFIYDQYFKISGVIVEDLMTNEQHHIYAKKIINATGPWVDKLREIDGSKQGKTLHLTKGVHLVFSKDDFPLEQAIYFDAPDGRMIFAIPRDNKTYVGTTDTTYLADLVHPLVTEADRIYILNAIQFMFPKLNLSIEKINSSWAGLRPLILEEGKKPGEISRKDEVFVSETGLISMAGGKLTGYRKMSENVVNLIVAQFKTQEGILYSQSETLLMPISGGHVGGSKGFKQFKQQKLKKGIKLGVDQDVMIDLIQKYGSNIDLILKFFVDGTNEAEKWELDPITFAKLNYAIECELAYKPSDFFIRRTGALFFDIEWVHANKNKVISYMQNKLNWNKEQILSYSDELETMIRETIVSDF